MADEQLYSLEHMQKMGDNFEAKAELFDTQSRRNNLLRDSTCVRENKGSV